MKKIVVGTLLVLGMLSTGVAHAQPPVPGSDVVDALRSAEMDTSNLCAVSDLYPRLTCTWKLQRHPGAETTYSVFVTVQACFAGNQCTGPKDFELVRRTGGGVYTHALVDTTPGPSASPQVCGVPNFGCIKLGTYEMPGAITVFDPNGGREGNLYLNGSTVPLDVMSVCVDVFASACDNDTMLFVERVGGVPAPTAIR